MNFDKLKNIGFVPIKDIDSEIEKISNWYKDNTSWWEEDYKKVLINRKERTSLK